MPIKITWFLLYSHWFLLIFSADFPLYFFVKHFQCKVNKAGANPSLVFGFAHFLQRSMTLTLIGPCLISPPSIHQHITIMLGSIRQNTKGQNSFWSSSFITYMCVCAFMKYAFVWKNETLNAPHYVNTHPDRTLFLMIFFLIVMFLEVSSIWVQFYWKNLTVLFVKKKL